MKRVCILFWVLCICFLHTKDVNAQSIVDSIAFFYKINSEKGLKDFLIDRSTNSTGQHQISDNDTIRSVNFVVNYLLKRFNSDSIENYNITRENSLLNRNFILTNDSFNVIIVTSLDTQKVIKSVVKELNVEKQDRKTLESPYTAVVIENFYLPGHFKLSESNYMGKIHAKASSPRTLFITENFLRQVNLFLNKDSLFHLKKVEFVGDLLRLYPTFYKDKWECDFNMYFKRIIFDSDMKNAIVEFSFKRDGGAAKFQRRGEEWILVNSVKKYYLD